MQDNLHLVRTMLEVDDKAALINLDQSKTFEMVYQNFTEIFSGKQ